MKKTIPALASDAEAEDFVASADLSTFDLSGFEPSPFEFASKDARVNMRLPEALLSAVKEQARRQGIPYQRFIRQALERAVAGKTKTHP